jgi:uncharacterized membrane protein
MNNLIIVSLFSTFFYCLAKFLEKRFLSDENEQYALKFIVRDAIIVFFVTFLANFCYSNFHLHLDEFLNIITDTKDLPLIGQTQIFTDTPNF